MTLLLALIILLMILLNTDQYASYPVFVSVERISDFTIGIGDTSPNINEYNSNQ